MNRVLRRFLILSAVLLLAMCCAVTAMAAGSGSLTVLLDGEDKLPAPDIAVRLYRVGEPDGMLTPDFADAGITPASLLSESHSAQNAAALATLADAGGLTGAEVCTDQQGEARFAGLSEGIYLVVCPMGQPLTFPVFLVRIPLGINGVASYDVTCRPKAAAPSDPLPPPDPAPDPGGSLPQTGADPLPLLLLLVGGCLLVVWGTADILRSRRDDDG